MATKEAKSATKPTTLDSESDPHELHDDAPRFIPEKDILAWKAYSRPFKKRSREYWTTIYSIAALLAFVLFLAEGVMPVILIISVVFLHYVMSTVNPEVIEYKITNRGVRVGDTTTFWDELTRYWFLKRMEYDLLVFETFKFPGKLEFVITEADKEKIRSVLGKYLPEEAPAETSVDKAVKWVSDKLPQS